MLRRTDKILIAVIVVLGLLVVVLFQLAGSAKDDRDALEQRLSDSQGDLREVRAANDRGALQQELEQLKAEPEFLALPTRSEALGLDSILINGAENLGVRLTEFNRSQGAVPVEGGGLPAIDYSLGVQGQVDALIEILRLVNDFPSAVVRSLQMSKSQEEWSMRLELGVFYQAPPPAKEATETSETGGA